MHSKKRRAAAIYAVLRGGVERPMGRETPRQAARECGPSAFVGGYARVRRMAAVARGSMWQLQVRIKKHRWHKKVLKNQDPLIFSIGWRRFQSIPLYCLEDRSYRKRMLKCGTVAARGISPAAVGLARVRPGRAATRSTRQRRSAPRAHRRQAVAQSRRRVDS